MCIVVWIFDHFCSHIACAPNALVASRFNQKPGEAQPKMRDTTWAGKVQKLVNLDGTPKGAEVILLERGFVNTKYVKVTFISR